MSLLKSKYTITAPETNLLSYLFDSPYNDEGVWPASEPIFVPANASLQHPGYAIEEIKSLVRRLGNGLHAIGASGKRVMVYGKPNYNFSIAVLGAIAAGAAVNILAPSPVTYLVSRLRQLECDIVLFSPKQVDIEVVREAAAECGISREKLFVVDEFLGRETAGASATGTLDRKPRHWGYLLDMPGGDANPQTRPPNTPQPNREHRASPAPRDPRPPKQRDNRVRLPVRGAGVPALRDPDPAQGPIQAYLPPGRGPVVVHRDGGALQADDGYSPVAFDAGGAGVGGVCAGETGARPAGGLFTLPHPGDPVIDATTGILLPNVEAKIIDDNGAIVPRNQKGTVCIRTPFVMKGYLNEPAHTAQTIADDGWIITGDIGWVDERDMLFVVGRWKDMFKIRNHQPTVAEIETAVSRHPGVRDVAVIPVLLQEGEEPVPRGYIVKKDGSNLSADELIAWMRQEFPPWIQLLGGAAFLDAIPIASTGNSKVDRKKLAEMAEGGLRSVHPEDV
ncbi:uncharacterized protein DSM5745_09810 [Aspergillus mulundensis]|uniref:AMP-dependent synthetase/ligase domain-containing protein n=1 Tax=Aspergillus mulundensis TaxID=1810919 RepID=A0A3D8QRG3_9EURO|nr:hypothetical protein DSM5745_09810 [Aspergillus mulundensis]RDW64399.1 hypothetical protein DSM5745_09810 [Aspergillus mulundensis]